MDQIKLKLKDDYESNINYGPAFCEFLVERGQKFSLQINMIINDNIIGQISSFYLECLDYFNTSNTYNNNKISHLNFPPDITKEQALQFSDFLVKLYTASSDIMEINNIDFVIFVYCADYFQMNSKIMCIIMSLIEQFHLKTNWILLGYFVEFYENKSPGKLAAKLMDKFIELLKPENVDDEYNQIKISSLSSTFLNTSKGRQILHNFLNLQSCMPNNCFEDMIDHISLLHKSSNPVSLKGIYDLLAMVNWFNVSFESMDKLFPILKTLYPDFNIPKKITKIRKHKENLINGYICNNNNKIFVFNKYLNIGKHNYIYIFDGYTSGHTNIIYLYTTDHKSILCKLEINRSRILDKSVPLQEGQTIYPTKAVLKIKNLSENTPTDNAILYICVTVNGINNFNEHGLELEKETTKLIKSNCCWRFKNSNELLIPTDNYKCEIIFHKIYYI